MTIRDQDIPLTSAPAMIRRTLVIVVPAHNEEARIGDAIVAYRSVAAKLMDQGIDTRIYVVDDGSEDRTRAIAQDAGASRVLRHTVNRGLGAAVRTGMTAARSDGADIVVKIDADLQHDPDDIVAIIRPILDDEAELVYGNRFNRIQYRMPLVRRLGNKVFTAMMRWMTHWPLADSQPGIFAAARTYLDVFSLPGDYNYTQQILLDAYHKGMRFAHVDVAFRRRETGKSFVSFRYPLKVLPQILMVIVGIRPLRIFAPIGVLFLGIAGTDFLWEMSHWFAGHRPKPVEHVNLVLGCALFGLQSLFFGIIAQLIIQGNRNR